jgi:2-dehydro-3-deoxyphosphogluconate aldolase / (4S)-4-hydroxy-2-oxoglutarate aldolase
MTREEVWQCISEVGIVPAVRASSPELAIDVAKAICRGGIPIVEIVMTMAGAINVIEELARTMGGGILIGAGAVVGAETAARCLDAGAEFLASPGFDAETVKLANCQEKLIMAGALTATEVITAWKAGSDFVKIFPCGNVGGASYIRALRSALPYIPMVPAGGVNTETAAEFLDAGASALGIGELIPASALKSGNLSAITDAARRYVTIVNEARKTANGNGRAG